MIVPHAACQKPASPITVLDRSQTMRDMSRDRLRVSDYTVVPVRLRACLSLSKSALEVE